MALRGGVYELAAACGAGVARLPGRADCGEPDQAVETDFGLESFNLRDFWATGAALTATMLAYNLMSLFCQSLMRGSVQSTVATLRHQVFAAAAWYGHTNGSRADAYTVAMPRQRRARVAGLWSAALDPPRIHDSVLNSS